MAPRQRMRLWVSPRFTERDRRTILAAARAWTDATHGLVAWSVDRAVEVPDVVHTVVVQSVARAEVMTKLTPDAVAITRCHSDDGALVRIGMDYVSESRFAGDDPLPPIAMHELGHALGLGHDVKGTVMAPNLDVAVRTVSCRDAHAWQALRAPSLGDDALCKLPSADARR